MLSCRTDVFVGEPPPLPVALALAEVVANHKGGLTRRWFDRVLDARMADLERTQPETLEEMETYVEALWNGCSCAMYCMYRELLQFSAARNPRHLGEVFLILRRILVYELQSWDEWEIFEAFQARRICMWCFRCLYLPRTSLSPTEQEKLCLRKQ